MTKRQKQARSARTPRATPNAQPHDLPDNGAVEVLDLMARLQKSLGIDDATPTPTTEDGQ